ncbi:MAG TPA: radical SAM protein [Armatimonadetes bacterium]|nr:radical SAM protein [Armatimonadota bacterium]
MFETQLIGADNVAIRRITPHLRLVFWEMTVGCNLNCIHCRRLETAHELMREDLSTSEAYRLIDGITEVGKPVLVLSGGEPLLRSDVFEIARYATERQLIVCLATNATLIDARTARMLQDAGIKRCAVSLDGADADTHDTFRAQPGSFDRALTGIRYLREAGVEVQINMTLTRYTAPHMQSVYELARNVGAIAFHVFLLVPVGCGAEIADEQMLTAQECEALLNELYELAQRGELQVKATCAPQFYRIINQRGIKTHRHHHIKSDEVEGRTS